MRKEWEGAGEARRAGYDNAVELGRQRAELGRQHGSWAAQELGRQHGSQKGGEQTCGHRKLAESGIVHNACR